MKKDDCIFCKLANGDIPTNALYEDDIVKVYSISALQQEDMYLLFQRNILTIYFQWMKRLPDTYLQLRQRLRSSLMMSLDVTE